MTLQEATIIIHAYRANNPQSKNNVADFMRDILTKVKDPKDRRTLLQLFCFHDH
jgi:hypothetical protein